MERVLSVKTSYGLKSSISESRIMFIKWLFIIATLLIAVGCYFEYNSIMEVYENNRMAQLFDSAYRVKAFGLVSLTVSLTYGMLQILPSLLGEE